MTPADLDLARRAVACAGWRPGMRTTCGRIVYAIERGCPLGVRMDDRRVRPDCAAIPHDALPDLNDPATLGCLLALVREAHGSDRICVVPQYGVDRWDVRAQFGTLNRIAANGPTEPAALVAALEAACQE